MVLILVLILVGLPNLSSHSNCDHGMYTAKGEQDAMAALQPHDSSFSTELQAGEDSLDAIGGILS